MAEAARKIVRTFQNQNNKSGAREFETFNPCAQSGFQSFIDATELWSFLLFLFEQSKSIILMLEC